MIWDRIRAVDVLVARYGMHASRIGAIGHSPGAIDAGWERTGPTMGAKHTDSVLHRHGQRQEE
jgi:hypothetical protein